MGEYVTIEAHKEFAERIDAENHRQNHRIDKLEESVAEIQRLTISVERMAVSTESMAKELQKQGARLDLIEKEPADKWKNAVWLVASALIAAAVGAMIRGLI